MEEGWSFKVSSLCQSNRFHDRDWNVCLNLFLSRQHLQRQLTVVSSRGVGSHPDLSDTYFLFLVKATSTLPPSSCGFGSINLSSLLTSHQILTSTTYSGSLKQYYEVPHWSCYLWTELLLEISLLYNSVCKQQQMQLFLGSVCVKTDNLSIWVSCWCKGVQCFYVFSVDVLITWFTLGQNDVSNQQPGRTESLKNGRLWYFAVQW